MTFEPGDILKVRPTYLEAKKYPGTYLLEKREGVNTVFINLKQGERRLYRDFFLSETLEGIFSEIDHVKISELELSSDSKELARRVPGLAK